MRLILTCFLVFTCFTCWAQPVLLPAQAKYENLGQKIYFFQDTTGNLTLSEIEKDPAGFIFEPSQNFIVNKGRTTYATWAKLNYRTEKNQDCYLIIDNANIDSIEVFYSDLAGNEARYLSGSYFPANTRSVLSTNYIFKLPSTGVKGKTVYARLRSANLLVIPIKLLSPEQLTESLIYRYIAEAIYIGSILAMLFYNLSISMVSRDKTYFFYVGYIICLSVYVLLYLRGYGHLLGDDSKNFITRYAYVFAAIGNICAVYFSKKFLRVRKNFPKVIMAYRIIITLWIITILFSLGGFRAAGSLLTQLLAFLTPVFILLTSFAAFQKGYRPAKYYLLGWIIISIVQLYFGLALFGLFPIGDFTFQSIPIGSTLQLVFLSFAMGDRLFEFRKKKESAQFENLKLVKSQKQQLEEKVYERTIELSEALEVFKASNKVKDRLFSIIAHDLRSPLNNLISTMQYSEDGLLTEKEITSFLKSIKTDVEQIQLTLNNLLNWAISQMEHPEYKPEEINIDDLIYLHIRLYHKLTENKGISIHYNSNPGNTVYADSHQLSIILRNLIDNAIKFTPIDGEISISAIQKGKKIEIIIKNSGEGMSYEKIKSILYSNKLNISRSGTANEQGTGLGLVLVKEFLNNMGSKLYIESESGIGTSFYFDLTAKSSS